jgi:hydrogenase maturation protein HypF
MRVRVRGAVQGVGFRPFIHALAARYDLSGFVLNDGEGVLAEVEGTALDAFLSALRREQPPLARIDGVDVTDLPGDGRLGFRIRETALAGTNRTCIVPDAATCEACLEELFDPSSRFHRYPFVTCTQCGPRFTIARQPPYDRAHTSMAAFGMCSACSADYRNPESRRFHAETIACPACGPGLSHPIAEIATSLQRGGIVALKGIGGFHLLCDATNEVVIAGLRHRKSRPRKPFAVMVANLASVAHVGAPTSPECDLLRQTSRPIVLIRAGAALAPGVAPGLGRIGVMLPSAPVHHLLFHALANGPAGLAWLGAPLPFALVATSANARGEPLAMTDEEAHRTLSGIADLIVTHDRPILERADDSVMAIVDRGPVFIRRSRGAVPDPIDLGQDGPDVLAVGGQSKATLCVTRGREAFVSQHVGNLGNAATMRFYADTARQMLKVLGVAPGLVACDLHPDYRSTVFAEATGLPLLRVQHHAAHLASVVAEHRLRGAVLGAVLDGHGYGADGGAWGGELLMLEDAAARRCGYLLPLGLPGGEWAAREPWRMGVAALVGLGRGADAARFFPATPSARQVAALLTGGHGATTTSMGRLFDAAAALLGVCLRQSYEGQAAMELEALVIVPRCLPRGYRIENRVLDFRPLLAALLTPGLLAREGAELFHGTLIAGLADWIGQAATALDQTNIVLSGGCMGNIVLAEGLTQALRERGLAPYLPRAVPANDGGLSLGQAALARTHLMTPIISLGP